MRKISFNTGWTCKHLEEKGAAAQVTLPHDAMFAEKRTETAAGGTNTGWYEGFDYEYEKHFLADESYQGKTVILEFEGVYRKAEVWIGDQQAAFRPYGYTNFYVDLTPYLEAGTEIPIRVIARNADQPNSRWYSGAGIYRPVNLWVGEAAHIPVNGVRVRTLSVSTSGSAQIEVRVRTSTPGSVKAEIFDPDGERILAQERKVSDKEAVMVFDVPRAQLWNVDTPKLYTCKAAFCGDVCEETFGIRTLSWDQNGFCINGSRTILQGACIHHDNGLLGAVCDPDAVERKVRILKENGYNALRSAHNPCSKALLNACDRQGMLVMDEYIDHWYIHKTEYDYVTYFDKWWRRDLEDMVDKDYNHPCVVMYSTGNEVSETAQARGIRLTGDMTDFLHTLDDSRPVTCGVNIFFNFLSSIGFGVYSDKKARKEAQKAEKTLTRQKAQGKELAEGQSASKKKKAVGSQFFNNLAGLLGDEFMKRGATLHGCDVKTRDAFANMDIAGYNYGIYRYRHDLKKYPERLILGTETFCKDAYLFRELAKENPRIIGDFVWAGMDYLGEVMVGSWEYADYAARFDGGCGWVSAGSGRIDLTGKPLCEMLYTKVALEKEKGPLIGVCPVNHTGDRHSPSAWKMSNALASWSWRGCEGRKANVEVYARAHHVKIFINGREAGEKRLEGNCIARFSCTYENGEIEAVSYDAEGREKGRTCLRTAEPETVLLAEPEEEEARAGHLCYIRLRYADRQGIGKPLVRNTMRVKAEGAELLALGNACPYNERGCLTDKTAPYYGEALAILRAGDGEKIRLKAAGGECRTEIEIPILQEGEPYGKDKRVVAEFCPET